MEITMTVDQKKVNNLLTKLSPEERDKDIRASLKNSADFLAGWIKTNRLTGPRPEILGVVTGRLRSSITSGEVEVVNRDYQIKIGTNVKYGPIHEFGYDEMVTVKPHMRRTGTFRIDTGTRRRGRRIGSTIGYFEQTQRHMKMPARPFMRPAVEDASNQVRVVADLVDRITRRFRS